MAISILIFLAVLSILILVHELGHFLTAKKMGVKVEEFGFGIPPRLFGKKIGETIYSVNASSR
jgi:regulator of sigma E protease